MARRIQLRRDTAANWLATNPTLAQGEVGVDLTSNKIKIGNGTSAWNSLSYFDDSETSLSNYAGHIIPSTDNTYDLGAPDKQWRDIFVSEGSIYIGDIKLSNDNGTLLVQRVTDAGLVTEEAIPGTTGIVTTDRLVNGDSSVILNSAGTMTTTSLLPKLFTATVDSSHYAGEGSLTLTGDAWYFAVEFRVNADGSVETVITNNTPWPSNPGYANDMPFEFTEADHGIPGYTFTLTLVSIQNPGPFMYTTNLTASVPPALPATVSNPEAVKLTADIASWTFSADGNIKLPAGGDIVDNTGTSVLGGGTISVGNGVGPSVEGVTEILFNGTVTEIEPGLVGVSIDAGPVQPYLQLTNEPLIVQPAILGTPVTVTAAPPGTAGEMTVLIENTGTTMSLGIAQAGTGYVVGQIYKIYHYQIGSGSPANDITFTVSEVGVSGEIAAVDNIIWTGPNTDGTYVVSIAYQPSVFDVIGPGLTLTRGLNQGIYNSAVEAEYDNSTYLSPLGTEWNSSGWGDLLQLGTRSYTTWRQALNNVVGNNILASELVMHDTANDKYYKFDFTSWGGNNGGYSYTRTEVTDPNYFRKPHNAELGDVIKENTPAGTGITIVRTDGAGIYNSAQEQGFVAESPVGTLWNADGWDDLSDLTTRNYVVFDLAANGYNNVLGKQFVMYVASTQTYYAVQFYEWATNGDNNFAYVRYEIDQTKLNEGITFADGTRLKSAAGVGRVKSTAAGDRRIEEVTGYNQVSVTGVTTNYITATVSRPVVSSNVIWIDSTTTTIDDIFDAGILNSASIQFSLDNVNWMVWQGSITYEGNERGYVVLGSNSYNQGDTVYFRYDTGGESVIWWDKADLPAGSLDFRGAVIDYHAYTSESTIIGTIHIIDDDGENHISHQEVQSGSTDGENDDLWLVNTEGQIRYRRIDGESKTLKIHWTAKVFYGSELYD